MPLKRRYVGEDRMYFKRLEIHGFKSFADPVTINFDRGITCVVGPNGSGKSNICDAIRWVLGAQSARALRGEKMEDVIFAGTAQRHARGMAEVTLVLDNEDQSLAIEYSEVAITRRMYRSGESEYLINNSRCRMKDIRELIMDTGIGVEGYSIIGQGKISDIISSNTESIREILEETAGIVMYRSKKEEAERKLASADANMERLGDIIGELESRLGGLREESEKAQRYLALRERHQTLSVNITLRHIEDLEKKHAAMQEDMQQTGAKIEELRRRQDAAADRIAEEETRRRTLDQAIREAHEESSRNGGEISCLQSQQRLHEEKLAAAGRDKERLEGEIAGLRASLEKETQSTEALQAERQHWEDKLAAIEQEEAQKASLHQERRNRLQEKSRLIDADKETLIRLQQTTGTCTAEIRGLESMKETLDARREEILREKANREQGIREARSLLEETKAAQSMLQAEHAQAAAALQEAEDTNRREEETAARCRREAEQLRIETGKVLGRLRAMEEMESNYEGFNNAVRFVMKSGVPGMEGVVADLLDVPAGMETAIETALGGAVQNIVCRDDAAARAAIEQLKQHKAGRATFLPLSSVRGRERRTSRILEEEKGFLGYGSECVDFDSRLQRIVDYLLGNVVVAATLNDAIRMSKKNRTFRFVTLEGEIIAQSGAVTGGRYRSKSAHIFARKSELVALKEKAAGMQRREQDLQAQEKAGREALHTWAAAIEEKKNQVDRLQQQLFSKSNEITRMEAGLSGKEDSSRHWQRELDGLAAQQAASEEDLLTLREEAAAGAAEIEALEKKLEEAIRWQEEEEKAVSSLAESLTEIRINKSSMQSEKARVDAVAGRIEEAREAYRSQQRAKEEQLAALGETRRSLAQQAAAEKRQLDEHLEAGTRLAERLQTLEGEKAAHEAACENTRAQKDALDKELHALAGQKTEMEIRDARMQTQLETARGKLWEEFEISYRQAMDYRKDDFVMSAAVREDRELKRQMKELGEVNVGAIEEYKEVSSRYKFLTEQRDDIVCSKEELHGIITDMDKVIHRKFKESFDQIVDHFESVYRELYGGGHARIILRDPDDPFGTDIEITAQPPGKQLKSINLLSGGEKTMTAIALMFAVLKTKPTPCCVLDEIEAALDDSNLNIFGNYVRRFQGVQFTLITHQKATMEHADVMYGVTMPESGVSKVYSLRMQKKG